MHQKVLFIKPDFSHLKVFGCLAYACTEFVGRTKLDPRSRRCVYLGYKHGTKGDSLFDLTTREIFLSRDVVFFISFPQNPNRNHFLSPHDFLPPPPNPFLSFLNDQPPTGHTPPLPPPLPTDLQHLLLHFLLTFSLLPLPF